MTPKILTRQVWVAPSLAAWNLKFLKGDQMKINIEKLSEKELIELNHQIVERLKFLESMRAHNKMMEFNMGDKVSFEPPGREKQRPGSGENSSPFSEGD